MTSPSFASQMPPPLTQGRQAAAAGVCACADSPLYKEGAFADGHYPPAFLRWIPLSFSPLLCYTDKTTTGEGTPWRKDGRDSGCCRSCWLRRASAIWTTAPCRPRSARSAAQPCRSHFRACALCRSPICMAASLARSTRRCWTPSARRSPISSRSPATWPTRTRPSRRCGPCSRA